MKATMYRYTQSGVSSIFCLLWKQFGNPHVELHIVFVRKKSRAGTYTYK